MGTGATHGLRRLARDAYTPPWFPERWTDANLWELSRYRLMFAVAAIAVDVGLYLWLRGVPLISARILDAFAAINIGLLSVNVAITATLLRRVTRATPWVLAVVLAIDAFTVMVWIQVTGTVSSYFIAVSLVLPLLYRTVATYWTALLAFGYMLALHVGAFALEEAGVLAPQALFETVGTTVYDIPRYRFIVMATMVSAYAFNFGISNLYVAHRRRQESALKEARDQLARAAGGAVYGRLSGGSIGDYELGDVLGAGGMGEVYRARRSADDAECAVKVLHPRLVRDATVVERFRREADAAARLGAMTARVLEARLDGAERFIAMEYLQGEDLAARLRRRGRLDRTEMLAILRGLATIVDAAHDAGLVHRDIKPHNVFLLDGDQVRLLDFGISKLAEADDDLTRTAAVLGSPGFMAPEQAAGHAREVGPAADVFSLGAIAYQAVTGERAFPARDRRAALVEVQTEHPARPTRLVDGLHEDVDLVLCLALVKDPAARYARASELVADLERALRGELSEDARQRARAQLPADNPVAPQTLTAP